jgi:hypothetical protein
MARKDIDKSIRRDALESKICRYLLMKEGDAVGVPFREIALEISRTSGNNYDDVVVECRRLARSGVLRIIRRNAVVNYKLILPTETEECRLFCQALAP